MDPPVYKVLKRLAPVKTKEENYCLIYSPNVNKPYYPYKEAYPSLVCTLPKGHSGYHVAHGGLQLGIQDPNHVLDVWE